MRRYGNLNESLDLMYRICGKSMLNEDQYSTKQGRHAISYMKQHNVTDPSQQKQIIDGIMHDLEIQSTADPRFNYLLGMVRLYLNREITSENEISQCRVILRYAKEFGFDESLNNQSLGNLWREVQPRYEEDMQKSRENVANMEHKGNSSYTKFPINSFEDASQLAGGLTGWCIANKNEYFCSYNLTTINQCYFFLKDGCEEIDEPDNPEESGAPLDEYGLSMISVIVGPDGEPKYVTTRYNHEYEGENNPNLKTAEQVSELLGIDFYKECPPRKVDAYSIAQFVREFVIQKIWEWGPYIDDNAEYYCEQKSIYYDENGVETEEEYDEEGNENEFAYTEYGDLDYYLVKEFVEDKIGEEFRGEEVKDENDGVIGNIRDISCCMYGTTSVMLYDIQLVFADWENTDVIDVPYSILFDFFPIHISQDGFERDNIILEMDDKNPHLLNEGVIAYRKHSDNKIHFWKDNREVAEPVDDFFMLSPSYRAIRNGDNLTITDASNRPLENGIKHIYLIGDEYTYNGVGVMLLSDNTYIYFRLNDIYRNADNWESGTKVTFGRRFSTEETLAFDYLINKSFVQYYGQDKFTKLTSFNKVANPYITANFGKMLREVYNKVKYSYDLNFDADERTKYGIDRLYTDICTTKSCAFQ